MYQLIASIDNGSHDRHGVRFFRFELRKRPKRHEAMRRAMAGREASRDNERPNMAAVLEGLPRAPRLDDERATSGRVFPRLRLQLRPLRPRQQQATSRPQVNATQNTRRTRPQSGPPARPSASSSPPAALETKRSPKALQLRPLRPLGRQAPCSLGNSRPRLPQRPAPSSYGAPAPTAAGQFASPQEAQSRCPGAAVVWVNEHSHIYHFAGTRDYGNTKRGAYMCEADAQAAGNRAAKNESHP